ncbi:unnamed protein product [Pieris macdunnoughi]|uniref:Uncharacterized protein n=1 Tax=Pieris macdunnoughi TaxID=345717 RepID=A0A821QUU0_9NEOP|nr:unnamed protein product [Pieris macdunnoughi]
MYGLVAVTEKPGYQSPYGGMDNGVYGVAATSCAAANGHHQPDRRHHHNQHHQHADVPPQWLNTILLFLNIIIEENVTYERKCTNSSVKKAETLLKWKVILTRMRGRIAPGLPCANPVGRTGCKLLSNTKPLKMGSIAFNEPVDYDEK